MGLEDADHCCILCGEGKTELVVPVFQVGSCCVPDGNREEPVKGPMNATSAFKCVLPFCFLLIQCYLVFLE